MPVQTSVDAVTTPTIPLQTNVSCLKHARHWTRISVQSASAEAPDVKLRMVRVKLKASITIVIKHSFKGYFILVVGGIGGSTYLDDVEVVPLSSISNDLPQLSPIPFTLGHSAGALDYSSKSNQLYQLRYHSIKLRIEEN